jgi:two-component system sensor histidine kinase QseC
VKPSSLRGRLRWLIVLVLIAVLVPLAVLSFQRTIKEVDELMDGRLAESARTLEVLIQHAGIASVRGQSGQDGLVPVPNEAAMKLARHNHTYTYEAEVGFQVFDRQGRLTLATANVANLPSPQPGDANFQDLISGQYTWRVYTLRDQAVGVVIRTAERYDSRNGIMHALWLDHGVPLLLGLPLLALLVGWAVTRGLRPLAALTRALSSHEPGSRQPIHLDQAPTELQPVLAALNAQLERQEDALERERRFSADVAHELRTPLASIMINLESAIATNDPAEAQDSLAGAQHSVVALARRIEQLLALARLEAGVASRQRSTIDVVEVAGEVIEELTTIIADSGVQLDFMPGSPQVLLRGYEAALAALLRNLIENALRHVPEGGQVQLIIEQRANETTLDVIDDGPGIPAEQRAAVFARFHREKSSRGEGYGLGLSIVQRAAELHDASIELLDSPFGTGLRVRVAIPRAG